MPPYTIILTDFGEPDWDLEAQVLRESGLDINLVRLETKVSEQLIPLVASADALIVQWANISSQVIDAMPHCKVISRYGIGVDMIDLEAASARGIVVANVHDYCIEEVSTQTIGFLLDLNRHTVRMNDHVRAGKWGVAPAPYGAPRRLKGQTLGIIGLGNIGRVVAQKGAGLGLKLLAYDPYANPASLEGLGVDLVGLELLLRSSDYVSIHCPLVEETRRLISAPQLALMQPDAYLINMARGPIVDQAALYRALVDGVIAGAALDVLEQEPPDPSDPLLQLPNVIITPHASSWSRESLIQLRRGTAQNVVDVLQDRLPRSVVNRKALGL
ncbi:MAG: C-terminal binding protein [Chloroflexota bacterium]|nr:C-terminal binding protein [Chloroflexota bacterium]